MKKTYRAPQGLLHVRSRGEGSQLQPKPHAQLESQPNQLQPELTEAHSEEHEEELRLWVQRPFVGVVISICQVKAQYLAMEQVLHGIGRELGTEPLNSLEWIRRILKVEVEDLQARIDYLLKENGELKTRTANQEVQLKEAEALMATAFEEKVWAQEEHDKAVAMDRKFHAFVEYPSDVINKA